jgi:autoinducer 2-degrading protein
MFAVIVDVTIKEEYVDEFHETVIRQGKNSRSKEPGCLTFDVLRSPEDPRRFTLYEVYTDEATFYETHLSTPHFAAYSATTEPWVESKSIRPLTKIWPD